MRCPYARESWGYFAMRVWCLYRGGRDAERAVADIRFQGHASVGKQAVSGNVRQAQRDAPINAAKASVTVAISPLPHLPRGVLAHQDVLVDARLVAALHRLPAGVAD